MGTHKKALVIGLGKSGRSACRYLTREGFSVCAVDDRLVQVDDPSISLVAKESVVVDAFDQIVVSPGVPPTHPVVVQAVQKGVEVVGDTELAFREIKKHSYRACAVTGTNGKTTTAMLIAHMLNACGIKAKAVGNIGVPLLDALEKGVVLVIELSSFQLETAKTACLEAACILNITPDHLDRHKNMQAYAAAKWRIAECVLPGQPLYVNHKIMQEYPDYCAKELLQITCFDTKEKKKQLIEKCPDITAVDQINTLAAAALCSVFSLSLTQACTDLGSFKKMPHRLEYICTKEGVSYYNDSKATNVFAVIPAVSSFDKKVILIAGGVHKGYPYTIWKEPFSKHVAAVFVIGEATEAIQSDLDDVVPVYPCQTLESALLSAKKQAASNGVVLLSPGCSSFDMFTNYEARGRLFCELVRNLEQVCV